MIKAFLIRFFGLEALNLLYYKVSNGELYRALSGPRSAILFCISLLFRYLPSKISNKLISSLLRFFTEQSISGDKNVIPNISHISFSCNNVDTNFNFKVKKSKRRIIVLCPAFDYKSISAGFYGVFGLANFLGKSGLDVSIALIDTFEFDRRDFKNHLQNCTGLEDLLNNASILDWRMKHKIHNIGDKDLFVATVWYTAYIAQYANKLRNIDNFLYFIQDYECGFYPRGALYQLARNTYDMRYHALISTKPLTKEILSRRSEKRFSLDNSLYATFNNPSLIPKLNNIEGRRQNKILVYLRSQVNRNMYELTLLALKYAIDNKIIKDDWEIYAIGLNERSVRIGDKIIRALPRKNLTDYYKMLQEFKVGLSLMASPHPSMPPIDFSASGLIAVTNSFNFKDENYFRKISKNIICVYPSIEEIARGLGRAIQLSSNVERITSNKTDWPKNWGETFNKDTLKFINNILEERK